jgi:hypothetical protein
MDGDADRILAGRLRCGNENGTVTILNSNTVATCRHCILPYLLDKTPIFVDIAGQTLQAEVIAPETPTLLDTVFLRLKENIPEERIFPLIVTFLPRGLAWNTFGFPKVRDDVGMPLDGTVDQPVFDEKLPRDVELNCSGSDLPKDFRGFSGAPVFVDGKVAAILQKRLDGGLAAISFAKLQQYLDAADVEYFSASNSADLPPSLQHELELGVPNTRTFWQLEEMLLEHGGGYKLLTGTPGSGKTMVTMGFSPTAPNLRILGRYFVGTLPGESLPANYFERIEKFASWLSSEAMIVSKQAIAIDTKSDVAMLAKSIQENIEALSASLDLDVLGLVFIDAPDSPTFGLDSSFWRYLPQKIPSNLTIIVSTNNARAFRTGLQHLTITGEVEVTPLPMIACEWIVRKSLGDRLLHSDVVKVTEMSLGHPLTLRFFIRAIEQAIETGDPKPIDTIEGGPDDYYERLWLRLDDSPQVQFLLACIARVRQRTTEQDFRELLPTDQKIAFPSNFAKVRHLMRFGETTFGFYHDSLKQFVFSKSTAWHADIHQMFADACTRDPDNDFAVHNILHHLLQASENVDAASRHCNQAWLDQAASRCVPPDLVLDDIAEVLRRQLRVGNAKEVIRLLLLRSRAHYRYNQAFLEFAAELANASLELRGPLSSFNFVYRNGNCICTFDEILTVLRRMAIKGDREQFFQIYSDLRRKLWAMYESGEASLPMLIYHMQATQLGLRCEGDEQQMFLVEMKRLGELFHYYLEHEPYLGQKEQLQAHLNGRIKGQMRWMFGVAPLPTDFNSAVWEIDYFFETTYHEGYLPKFEVDRDRNRRTPVSDLGELYDYLRSCSVSTINFDGIEDVALLSLMRAGVVSEVVSATLRQKCKLVQSLNIRDTNGVDENLNCIETMRLVHATAAYVDDDSILNLVDGKYRHRWELGLLTHAADLGRLAGRRYRSRARKESSQNSLVDDLTPILDRAVGITLGKRVDWEDSYHLPENIIPRLIYHAATMIAELEPQSAPLFVRRLLEHADRQFGLYIEGTLRVLSVAADVLATVEQGIQPASDLRRKQADLVSRLVFARKLRVSTLLDCARHLAILGATEDANNVFDDAVRSSMGPNWYKEDQFSLLVDALKSVNDVEFTKLQLKQCVETLAHASGECTFQRYVRYEKEHLIAHLSKMGLFGEALELTLAYLYPPYELQKSRITRVPVDMTGTLSGLRSGVQEVDEQKAILSLLKGLRGAKPLLRWAVVELFLPWGDERHFSEFAHHISELLESNDSEVIQKRFLALLRHEISPDRRDWFARAILASQKESAIKPLLDRAFAQGILDRVNFAHSDEEIPDIPIPPRSQELETPEQSEHDMQLPGVFGSRQSLRDLESSLATANERLQSLDKAGAKRLVISSLREVQKSGWNIWSNIELTNTAFQLLFEIGPSNTVLSEIEELVLTEEQQSDWVIARGLLIRIMKLLEADKRRDFFGVIADHISSILKPEQSQYSVSDESKKFEEPIPELTADACIESLLITLLDHPNCEIRSRTALIVSWLLGTSVVSPSRIINRICSQNLDYGKEIAIGLLGKFLTDHSVQFSDLATATQFATLGRDPNALVRNLVESSAGAESTNTNDFTSEADDKTVAWSFEASRRFQMNQQWESHAKKTFTSLCAPFSTSEFLQLSEVRRMSFGYRRWLQGTGIEREAIYRSWTATKDSTSSDRLSDTTLWNPYWPDSTLDLDAQPICEKVVDKIENDEGETAFVDGDYTLLHAFEATVASKHEQLRTIEIVAVLVFRGMFDGNIDLRHLWQNGWKGKANENQTESGLILTFQEPAVTRFEPKMRVGGDNTPAMLSSRIVELVGSNDCKRVVWQDGRHWDAWGPGPPVARGSRLMILTSLLENIRDYQLIWVVLEDEMPKCIVDVARKTTYWSDDV